MPAQYVMAIDQGTTSTRCLVFDQRARLVAVVQREHRQYYPKPGWVEHDPTEIWRNVDRIVPQALREAGVTAEQVAGLGIANQRETTVLWDRRTGKPLAPAIVWQDTRPTGWWRSSPAPRERTDSAPPPASPWRPTSPGPRCAGCSTSTAPCLRTRFWGPWTPG